MANRTVTSVQQDHDSKLKLLVKGVLHF